MANEQRLPFSEPARHTQKGVRCLGGLQGAAAGPDGYFPEEPVDELRGTWSNCALRLTIPVDWVEARIGATGPRIRIYALDEGGQTPIIDALVSALSLTGDARGESLRGTVWAGGQPSLGGFKITISTDDEDGRDGTATVTVDAWGDQSTPNSMGEDGSIGVTPFGAPARNGFTLFFDETAGRWVPGLRGPGGGIVVEPSTRGGIWSDVHSTALEAFHLIAAAPATLRMATVRLDSTAPGGTHYVQVYNSAANPPGNGPVAMLIAPVKVQHVNGIDDWIEIELPAEGLRASVGIGIGLSSTEFTRTASGAFLSIDAIKG